MKIAIYSLTYNRFECTEHCFKSLWDKAGYPFSHYVVDNGSEDGTRAWLDSNQDKFSTIVLLPNNFGISRGSNIALNMICHKDYDLVIKMDNDCEIVSDDTIKKIAEIYQHMLDTPDDEVVSDIGGTTIINKKEKMPTYILSPKVEYADYPAITGYALNGTITLAAIVRGVFKIAPINVVRQYRYPENLPLSIGQDSHFCEWAKEKGYQLGHIEDLFVNHYSEMRKYEGSRL